MRALPPLILLLLLSATSLAAHPAAAHAEHGGCLDSDTLVDGVVHVDAYGGRCDGATVGTSLLQCALYHDHPGNTAHVVVLHGPHCETGVITPYPILP